MINAATVATGIEGVQDAIANILLSMEFHRTLEEEHAKHAKKIAFRRVEMVYTEDMETLDAYPACELIPISLRSADPMRTVEISAQWSVNGDHEQDMGREVRRLVMATIAHFDGKTLVPYFGGSPVRVGDADFGPIVLARNVVDTGKWLKSAAIPLFVDFSM